MKELEKIKWVTNLFTNHKFFKDEDAICGLSDDYTEIYVYLSALNMEPIIRIENVEMVNETVFVCQIPETQEAFNTLISAAGFIR